VWWYPGGYPSGCRFPEQSHAQKSRSWVQQFIWPHAWQNIFAIGLNLVDQPQRRSSTAKNATVQRCHDAWRSIGLPTFANMARRLQILHFP